MIRIGRSRDERLRRRRVLTAVAVVLTAGFALAEARSGRADGPATTDPAPSQADPREPIAGPTDVADGVPSGFARTREGAIAAAAGFVRTGQLLLDADPLKAERAVRRMAAGASADRLVADTRNQLRAVREAVADGSGPIVFRQGVIAHRVEAFAPRRARVAVWHVGVLTRERIAPPQAGWATSTFELVWERDDWRIWSETIVPGPAPVLNDSVAPASAAAFLAALEGFEDFGRPS